jgi:hypothetical protein
MDWTALSQNLPAIILLALFIISTMIGFFRLVNNSQQNFLKQVERVANSTSKANSETLELFEKMLNKCQSQVDQISNDFLRANREIRAEFAAANHLLATKLEESLTRVNDEIKVVHNVLRSNGNDMTNVLRLLEAIQKQINDVDGLKREIAEMKNEKSRPKRIKEFR